MKKSKSTNKQSKVEVKLHLGKELLERVKAIASEKKMTIRQAIEAMLAGD